MSKLISGAIAGALLGAAGSAAAMPVVFDWSNMAGNDYTTNVYTATNSGLTVKITGYNGRVYVDRNGTRDGLGVWSDRRDSDDVNYRHGRAQGLWLSFSEEVTLEGLRFLDGDHNYNFLNAWYGHDEFDLYADGSRVLNGYNIEDHDVFGRVGLAGYTGTRFLVKVDDYNDSWYLNGLKASTNVPEPGSMALLGLGIAGLGLARRKRRA